MNRETFVLVDIEADGPVPGRNSMLSFAAVAFRLDRTILGTFSRNLETLPGAAPNPPTMAWWEKFPEAWAACRESPVPPKVAMEDFLAFVRGLPDLPAVFVANPVSYDWVFIHHYIHVFTDYTHAIGENLLFQLTALDVRSFGMAVLGCSFRKSNQSHYPKAWTAHGLPHTHKAIDDAMGHAMTFCAMHEAAQQLHSQSRNVFIHAGSDPQS